MISKTRKLLLILMMVLLSLAAIACDFDFGSLGGSDDGEQTDNPGNPTGTTASIEAFQNHEKIISTPLDDELAFIQYGDGLPHFTDEDWNSGEYYIRLSDLDELGRVSVTQGLFDEAHFPDHERGSLSSVTPTGWKYNGKSNNHTYSFVSNGYIYNRCHTLAFSISSLEAEKRALITGTRFFNIEGNYAYEELILDHLKEMDGTNGEPMHQVLIKVTPDFHDDFLLCHGIVYEADCLQCDDIDFAVYMFNKQPGITINYATGENWANDSDMPEDPSTLPGATDYVYSSTGDKFHVPSCRYAEAINEDYRVEITAPRSWMTDTLHLDPCGVCKP